MLLMPQSLWSRSAAEGSALGNEPCCRVLPCGWFSSLYTWRVFLGGAHPPSSSDGIKQNSLAQLSLEGFVCSPLSRACWDFVPSFTPELCFFEKCLVNMGFSSCSRHKGPGRSCLSSDSHSSRHQMLAQTRDSHELRSLEAVPWVPGRTGSRDGETRSSQGSSPSPFPARALLGPCAAGFAGQTGTDPAGRARLWGCHQPCQGRANSSLLHPKQTQQFPGIFRRVGGVLWMIPFISSGVGGELP